MTKRRRNADATTRSPTLKAVALALPNPVPTDSRIAASLGAANSRASTIGRR